MMIAVVSTLVKLAHILCVPYYFRAETRKIDTAKQVGMVKLLNSVFYLQA